MSNKALLILIGTIWISILIVGSIASEQENAQDEAEHKCERAGI